MKLTILGSGTCSPQQERHMAGYLVEIQGTLLLLDSGPGTIYQVLKANTDLNNIDIILYTHFHNDHISDLPALLHAYLHGLKRKKKLRLYGPPGFKNYFEKIKGMLAFPENHFEIEVDEAKASFQIGTIQVTTAKMNHQDAIGYRIQADKTVVYSGDTGYCQEIIDLAKDADLLLLECSYPNEHKQHNHLTPKECAAIATESNAKKLILTHFYPEMDANTVSGEMGTDFNGEVMCAHDLMEVKV